MTVIKKSYVVPYKAVRTFRRSRSIAVRIMHLGARCM